jgi:PE family
MSLVIATPEFVTAAATDLANVGSSLSEANAAAAASTTGVVVAAGDEVSAAIASLFSGHAQAFQALSAQTAAFHAQFMQALNAAGGAYAAAEAANALPLRTLEQDVLGAINAPFLALTGRPLIGNGASGPRGSPRRPTCSPPISSGPRPRSSRQRREQSSPAHRHWQPSIKSVRCLH